MTNIYISGDLPFEDSPSRPEDVPLPSSNELGSRIRSAQSDFADFKKFEDGRARDDNWGEMGAVFTPWIEAAGWQFRLQYIPGTRRCYVTYWGLSPTDAELVADRTVTLDDLVELVREAFLAGVAREYALRLPPVDGADQDRAKRQSQFAEWVRSDKTSGEAA